MFRGAALLACVLAWTASAWAQPAPSPDPVATLLKRLEQILNSGDRASFPSLFSGLSDELIAQHAFDLFMPGAVRTVVHERDRTDLEGAPPGDGYRVVVELFIETPRRAKIVTAGLDIRRPPGGDLNSWRIVRTEGVASVEGLFRLRLITTTQYAARNLEVRAEDLLITLQDGTVFQIDTEDGITGLILLGRGEMRFSPTPETERGQLRIFSGNETLTTPFEAAFVRLNPTDYARLVTTSALTNVMADARMVRRAQEVFARDSPKSYVLDLQDLSRDTWHLQPPANDMLLEVQTRRYGILTYTRGNAQAEDVQLFQRDRRRTIALYASQAKLAARGRFYSDDALREYDVIDYNIEAIVDPERQSLEARARLAIRARASLSTLTLRLADRLEVSSVTSVEYGRLLHLRVSNQNTIMISLPRQLPQDSDITLILDYAGRVAPDPIETETLQTGQDPQPTQGDNPFSGHEPHYLLSNRSLWYPQNPVPDYATATIRLVVPEGYGCVASGEPVKSATAVSLRDLLTLPGGKPFVFRANQPLRYLAFVVSRFDRVLEKTIATSDEAASDPTGDRLMIAVEANTRQRNRARQLARPIEEILRFYTGLMATPPIRPPPSRSSNPIYPAVTVPATSRSSTIRCRIRASRGATIRPPSMASASSSWHTSSRINGGARRSAGRTITSSGSARASRSTSRRSTRRSLAATRCSSTCCASSAAGRSPIRIRVRCISATVWGTSRATRACSARSSTTRAPPCCTCCGDCSATKCSSTHCAASIRIGVSRKPALKISSARSSSSRAAISIASSNAGSTAASFPSSRITRRSPTAR
jgi:hypothetical protein